jgi:hypothetical protein
MASSAPPLRQVNLNAPADRRAGVAGKLGVEREPVEVIVERGAKLDGVDVGVLGGRCLPHVVEVADPRLAREEDEVVELPLGEGAVAVSDRVVFVGVIAGLR